MHTSLKGIAKKAKDAKKHRFRNLSRMLTKELLLDSWKKLNKTAAVGVDVLLAAHHGSRTSNDPKFLQKASPRYLVISAGPYRPLPKLDLAEISGDLQKEITPLATAGCGSITFRTGGPHLRVETYRRCLPEEPIPL